MLSYNLYFVHRYELLGDSMKNFVLVLFVSLSCSLSAMDDPDPRWKNLPPELVCEIVRKVVPDQVPITPQRALRTQAEIQHMSEVESIAYSPDGKQIASGGWGNKLEIIAAETGKSVAQYRINGLTKSLSWSPDGHHIAQGGLDKVVTLIDGDLGVSKPLYRTASFLRSLSWSPDSRMVMSIEHQNWVVIARVATGAFVLHAQPTKAGCWLSNQQVALLCSDGDIRILDVDTCNEVMRQRVGDNMQLISSSPNGQLIALATRNGRVQIMKAESLEMVSTYRHKYGVESISWSPNSKWISSGGRDNRVKLVDVQSGALLAQYKHSDVSSVCWSPEGDYFASGGLNKRVVIKSFAPLMLARFALPESTTLARFDLLKKLQKSLILERKEAVIIGGSERKTLEEMPDLKKLLKIETNEPTKDKVATLWRLKLEGKQENEGDPACTIL